ncbi:MAG TPA: hypothetical protein VKS01_01145, partial [Bryobacteraceae bacterium]|nr:hypothetical protein [Bryobacteraceae bacterium]
ASTGMWAQDSWRLRPNPTINYGLRWDFVGDDYDVNGGYSTLPSLADLWGPTPVGHPFQPGLLGGVANPTFNAGKHAYNPSYLNPSPAIALAWAPQANSGWLGKLTGGKDRTVIRTGYSLRHYTEGAQNFWAFAADGTNGAPFFFQQGALTSNPTPALGNFAPGSLSVGNTLPPYFLTPAAYSTSVPFSTLWPSGGAAMNPNIAQPYLEQWNFGIQRGLGAGSAIEIRYVGNLALHQWLAYNLNEVNIVENGFLGEFQHAQANLAANAAGGKGNSFAYNGLPGQFQLPILSAAFLNQSNASGFGSGTFITDLRNGAAGTFANQIATNTTFFCNMVGTTAFPACLNKGANFPAAGAFPINFWEVNPFATGNGNYDGYLDAAGMSDYHGLQVEFRQRLTHGAQFNVNYTWSHSLGISAQDGIQGQGNNIYYTDRNFKLNYSPGLFDIRQVVHASGTYDLPFGKGRHFMNNANRIVDGAIGGWTLGTILVMQTGTPAIMGNGFSTFNNNDSGVYFNGLTAAQVQSGVGVYHTGNPWVYTVNPNLIAANGAAASSLQPANVAGVLGYRPYIYGPHWFNDDFSINKTIPIRERIHMTLQGEFLNLTNHPAWNIGSLSVQSTGFGQVTGGPTQARRIELRANIEF